tara:strand:- start:53 stop:1015 length:963 start_codon:yes stop_codon:yes gene_type:complete
MAFLDNSGDIIFSAVLTDTGRMRMAKGDGSFSIAKFCCADDEIDYTLYNKNNPSGSAYYDVEILQTPILEPITNNTSQLHSKLISINNNSLLYLPMLKLFTTDGLGSSMHSSGIFAVPVNKATVDTLKTLGPGILNGFEPNSAISHIRVDQGLDTVSISAEQQLAMDLVETQYIVEMDNRLGQIYPPPNAPAANNTGISTNSSIPSATPSFVDDDNIASYYFTLSNNNGYVTNLGGTVESSIAGPRGTTISFRIGASLELASNASLFTEIGSLASTAFANSPPGSDLAASAWQFIDSTIRITGVNTGSRVDVPVRLIRAV